MRQNYYCESDSHLDTQETPPFPLYKYRRLNI
jgi:hypothetical protein